MKFCVSSALPTIYADMNVYRYIAYNEITIVEPERFKWVYLYVHLNEVMRGCNTDVFKGMKILNAVEISDVLDQNFKSVGNILLHEYIDPFERYERHLEAMKGFENQDDFMVEHLLRIFGADNFKELSLTPDKLCNDVERLTNGVENVARVQLLKRAEEVSNDLKKTIETYLNEKRPIDKTRKDMGLTSQIRKEVENSDSPIDEIWEIISPALKGISKNQFWGFEQMPWIQGLDHTQHGAFAGAHTVLNLLGLSPDIGLSKSDKIKNIMSDGQHVGMASYCDALLSADSRICNKANAIYKHIGLHTNALFFKYDKGCVINLGIT
jgi:hypothetical protein